MYYEPAEDFQAMSADNFMAYAQAWCVSEVTGSNPALVNVDVSLANDAVKAGIIFS